MYLQVAAQNDKISRANVTQRREDFEHLCSCLDFENLQVLDDTVTELLIKRKNDSTPPYYQEDDIVVPEISLPLMPKASIIQSPLVYSFTYEKTRFACISRRLIVPPVSRLWNIRGLLQYVNCVPVSMRYASQVVIPDLMFSKKWIDRFTIQETVQF
ncbi:serine/threonine protein kinase [Venturia nashicola]|nr:serine/threonine protein kinase [Venturia nashicola]